MNGIAYPVMYNVLNIFLFFSLQFKSTPGAKNEFAENVIELLKLPEMGS